MKYFGGFRPSSLSLFVIISAGLHLAALTYPGFHDRLHRSEERTLEVLLQHTEERSPTMDNSSEAVEDINRDETGFFGSSGAVPLGTDDPRYRPYFEVLKEMIFRSWSYPLEASRKKQKGKVLLEFGLTDEGRLSAIQVMESSGSQILDRAVVDAIRKAAPFPFPPKSIQRDPFLVSALFVYEG